MHFPAWQTARMFIAGILIAIFSFPASIIAAETHVVSPADLQRETIAASQARAHNLQTVTQFVSSQKAEKALRSAHIDPIRVKAAVSSLTDAELAQLASRSARAQADFAGGRIDDHDLLIILVAVAVLVLVIVAVR
jgi:hypothetical protein